MSLSIGAIGAVSNGESVYAALSPYLNGVVRTSDAAALAQADAVAQSSDAAVAQAAIAANGDAAATAAATPPFANPAITAIGERLALAEALPSGTTSITPDALVSPATVNPANAPASTLTGDSGLLVQSYGAIALLAGIQAVPPIYGLPPIPAIAPVAKTAALASVRKVA